MHLHSSHPMLLPLVWFGICTLPAWAQPPPAEDLESLQEKAIKAAVTRVAPSVVQIETSGGSDIVGSGPAGFRKGTGPTTGLIVAADGYVLSSAFNFANRPSAIFITIPGRKERLLAKVVATDHTRMITLLKVEADGLPVPVAAPKKEIQVGQWAFALGRTWTSLDKLPSISVGIVSALGRIWGKAIQTDAKVSPVNYGGPLIDLEGRVLGVLVPASPRGQDETAGVEWYDSGIGFAIPLEDLNSILPRLKTGQDLKRGLLGVYLQSQDIYGSLPVIASVSPESAAHHAGLKPGDTITEINGVRIARQAQMMHLLGPKYEGDMVSVRVQRGKEEINLPELKLTGELAAFIHPFLGILPVRDDPEEGEEIRYVFPKSPAETAGLSNGDRILKVGLASKPPHPFSGRDQLTAILDQLPPGTELTLEVNRKENKKTETVKVTLGMMQAEVPEDLPADATRGKALEQPRTVPRPDVKPIPPETPLPPKPRVPRVPPKQEKEQEADKKEGKKKPQTGLVKRTTPAGDHDYWIYVPDNYDPNVSYALVVWLHPEGKGKDRETETVVNAWEDFCNSKHVILLCPRAENETGWLGSEADFVVQIARAVMDEYTIDRQRVIAHGMGVGGQMAFYLGFHAREHIRGVATTGAALTNNPKDNVANQRLAFFIVAGGKDPLAQLIAESKAKLIEHKYPVVYQEVPEMGHEYLDVQTLGMLMRWIDSLDRQ